MSETAPALAQVVPLRTWDGTATMVHTSRGRQSIQEAMEWMVGRIVDDARHPLVVEWARQSVAQATAAGATRSTPNPDYIAQAVCARLEREAVFVRDPVDTEWIAGTVQVLCLDPENDLCLNAGDCDCLVRACASALVAVGIPVKLDCRFYPKLRQAHIMIAYDSDPYLSGKWSCLDPSVPGGRCSTAIFQGQIVMEVVMGRTDGPGTFVGMGEPLEAMGDPPVDAVSSQTWLQLLAMVRDDVVASLARLRAVGAAYLTIRQELGLPTQDPSPSPSTGPLSDYLQAFAWTVGAQTAEAQLEQAADFVGTVLTEALAGKRVAYWSNADLLVAAATGDPYGLLLMTDAQGVPQLTFVDGTGATTGTMGAAATIALGGAAAACTLASAEEVAVWCEAVASAHHRDALARLAAAQQAQTAGGTVDAIASAAGTLIASQGASSAPASSSYGSKVLAVGGGALLGYLGARLLAAAA